MTAVGFGESTRYALRLYAYVLGVFVVGGVGVGLGAALLWPEVRAWRGPGQAAVAPGIAGGLLVFLGVSVLTIGWIGTAYKLLADGVAAQTPDSSTTDRPPEDRNSAGSAASPGRSADGNPPSSAERDDQPPEPSPAEIAFGTDDESRAGSEATLPGRDGADDPLGEQSG
jgi:hypothetical protein